MKRILKISFVILIMMIPLILFSGCGNSKNENNLKSKVDSEIAYLDREIVSMINQLNNVNYERYKVNTEEIKNVSQGSSESKGSESSDSEGDSEKQSNNGLEKKSGESNGSKSSSGNEKENNKSNKYSMESNTILGQQQNIDWNNLRNKTENLYITWTAIYLDLKEIGVPNEKLNLFISNLDLVASSVKNEDKNMTIDNLIKLYETLTFFVDSYDSGNEKDVLISKYNLLICYKYANLEDTENLKSSVSNLKMSFSNIINKKSEYKGKDYNIDSSSIIIDEMNNNLEVKNDRDIFFIKYKNLMQELNIISSI